MIDHLLFLYLRTVLSRSWNELMDATHQPARMQANRLMDILSRNRDTAFGREHSFSIIRSLADFRELVPVRPYEEFEPYIERLQCGERQVLTKEEPEMFGRTSGTTSDPKFIPITPSFYEEFSKTQKMWQRKLLADHRRMARGKILSVMSAEIEGYTECGIPYGAMSGHSYQLQYPLTQQMYAVPYEVMCLKDFEAKYYLVLRLALERNVTAIAALNPSTIVLLMKKVNLHADELIRDIADGSLRQDIDIPRRLRSHIEYALRPNRRRARELEALRRKDALLKGSDLWGELEVITTWQGGSAGFYISRLSEYFPEVPLRDMGLIATEAYCSIPLWSNTPRGLLAITGHFFEFFEVGEDGGRRGKPLGPEEVEIGREYYLVITTSGGLYRYDIQDIVKVVDRFNRTPVIVFQRKGGNTVSITGEKLTETQVTEAVGRGAAALAVPIDDFVLTLRLSEPPAYVLLVETPERNERLLRNLLDRFERELRLQNIEYAGKRDSQRLGHPSLCIVENGCFEQCRKRRVESGAPDGQYKIARLMYNSENLKLRIVSEIKSGGQAL
ncbi:MAG: hypothetical protein C4520_17795 [Candidatus Abyssobacteria bacterium SURF_5]|uniref:GH3 auxin-responsive promoter family protein n=1 Tax=Abyssobacteria bacterium (strain SURF_5) TaxID=2093360 RepID=A0A3A4NE88_ABYX5|nr:MAG: hypothetical protein C4520_17795 [Candidatus Abyssubacteria bacterium SURF_5]